MKRRIKNRLLSTALAFSMGLCLAGCGKEDGSNGSEVAKLDNLTQNVEVMEVETKDLDERFIEETANFSVDLFKESTISDIELGENVLISPQSIITAMSMTTNGAKGNTLSQLQDTMYGGMEITEYNTYMQDYSGRLTQDKYVDFYLANSIWIKEDPSLHVEDSFLGVCKSYYDAGVYTEPFNDETTNKLNGWVKDNTSGMIDSIVDTIPQDAVMYLINATAFSGEWQNQYEENQINEDGVFTSWSGNKENVTMLNSAEDYYLQDDMARGFIKYYKGGGYAFMAMLPNDGISVEEYVSNLTGDKIIDTYNNREYLGENVMVNMPEFSYEYDRELSEDFKNLGVTDAFSDDIADLSGMAQSDAGNLYIGRVLHKTYIELDRNGTKAAAVTAVEVMCETAAEPVRMEKITLDKPFFYAIIDGKTGLPVFMGVVNSVN